MQQSYSVLQGQHKSVPLAICFCACDGAGQVEWEGHPIITYMLGVFPDLGEVYRFLRVTNSDRRVRLDAVCFPLGEFVRAAVRPPGLTFPPSATAQNEGQGRQSRTSTDKRSGAQFAQANPGGSDVKLIIDSVGALCEGIASHRAY